MSKKRRMMTCVSASPSVALNAVASARRSVSTSFSALSTEAFAAATACRGNDAIRSASSRTNGRARHQEGRG